MAEENRRWHDSNSGSDSDPVVWKLEGNQVLWCAASAGVGIMLFRILHGTFDHSISAAVGLALMPLIATTGFVLALKTGKPPSYAGEFVEAFSRLVAEWLAERIGFGSIHSVIGRSATIPPHPLIDDE